MFLNCSNCFSINQQQLLLMLMTFNNRILLNEKLTTEIFQRIISFTNIYAFQCKAIVTSE